MNGLLRPKSLSELFSCGKALQYIAGGTDWMIQKRGALDPSACVADLTNIRGMRGVSLIGDALRIGAAETMTAVSLDAKAQKYASALSDAARVMGSEQIRNMATVGGNLANCSPAADTPPALSALDAEAVVSSANGDIKMRVCDMAASRKSTLQPGDVISAFLIPIVKNRYSAFMKVGSRSQVSISRVNMAVSGVYENSAWSDVRLFIGTLGSAAARCREAEPLFFTEEGLAETPKALAAFAETKIPGRSTLPYKKSVLHALFLDIRAELLKRSGASK